MYKNTDEKQKNPDESRFLNINIIFFYFILGTITISDVSAL